MWRSGPDWLTNPGLWPLQKDHVAVCELGSELIPKPLKPVCPRAFLDEQGVSTWQRLIRLTRSIQKAASRFAGRNISGNPAHYWFRKVQMEHFPLVIAAVRDNQSLTRSHPSQCLIDQLGLYWDKEDELVKCRGRLEEAELRMATKQPILLPNPSHITEIFTAFDPPQGENALFSISDHGV